MSRFIRKSLICLISLSLTGCYTALAYAPDLLLYLAGAVAGMENVEVKAAVSPGLAADELQKIKRVAVVIGGEGQSQSNPQLSLFMAGGDLSNIMADNIALELINLGYHVIERTQLGKVVSEQELQMTGLLDTATAAKVGKIMGVDAVVLCNVATSQKMQTGSGFMEIGADVTTAQVVSNATVRIVGVEHGNVLMLVTLSYKKGQKPTEAAKTMAIALAEKLKNPMANVAEK